MKPALVLSRIGDKLDSRFGRSEGVVGMQEMDGFLEQWRLDEAEVRLRMYLPSADAPGTGTVARGVVAGPGLDGSGGRTSPEPWSGMPTP